MSEHSAEQVNFDEVAMDWMKDADARRQQPEERLDAMPELVKEFLERWADKQRMGRPNEELPWHLRREDKREFWEIDPWETGHDPID